MKKENDNINLTIINARFIKPIDENMLIKLLTYYKKIYKRFISQTWKFGNC